MRGAAGESKPSKLNDMKKKKIGAAAVRPRGRLDRVELDRDEK